MVHRSQGILLLILFAMLRAAFSQREVVAEAKVVLTVDVRDESGAGIPGAQVKLTKGREDQSVIANTGRSGTVSLHLAAGSYQLSVTMNGFKTAMKQLDLGNTIQQRVAIVLRIGGCPSPDPCPVVVPEKIEVVPSNIPETHLERWEAQANVIASREIRSCVAIPNKIRAGTYIKSRDVRYCLEVFLNSGDSSGAVSFVRELQPLLSDRPELKAQLLAREGSMYVHSASFRDAADSFQAALVAIEPLHLEVDLLRLTTLVNLGEALLSEGHKKEAEDQFLQALSYPWYAVVGHPEEMQKLRDQYVAAGRGLIDARRGDLKALKEIVFVPATYEVLGPVLEEAIKEAQPSTQSPLKNN